MKSGALQRNRVFGVFNAILFILITVTGCNDNPPKTLHMAALKGNTKAVMGFFKDGATPNAKGQDGERPLHFAVYGNRIGMVQFLLDKGADINATNDSGSTPLHAAAWKGHIANAELLIANGAKLDAKNRLITVLSRHCVSLSLTA